MNLTKKQVVELLHHVFVPRSNGLEGVCFSSDYMREENAEKYAIYNAISSAMEKSDLRFDFGYTIGEKAVDILVASDDWSDDDRMAQDIDAAIPVYNHELLAIYAEAPHVVDDAVNEIGLPDSCDVIAFARTGWSYAITNMVEAIKSNLAGIISDDNAN